jgi:hypothetical protein
MVDTRRGSASRRRRWRKVVAGSCLGLLPVAAGGTADAAATPLTYHVEGLIGPRSDGTVGVSGDFVGTYRSIWQSEQSVVRYGSTTLTTAEGVDGFLGCLDLDHDRRCGQDEPKGTITMAFRRISAYQSETHTLIESSCTRPVIGTSGRFTGGLLFVADRAAGPDGATSSVYRGELTVSQH